MDPVGTGPECKQSEGNQWLSTTNEWQYYCPRCDLRFNGKGEGLRGADVRTKGIERDFDENGEWIGVTIQQEMTASEFKLRYPDAEFPLDKPIEIRRIP